MTNPICPSLPTLDECASLQISHQYLQESPAEELHLQIPVDEAPFIKTVVYQTVLNEIQAGRLNQLLLTPIILKEPSENYPLSINLIEFWKKLSLKLKSEPYLIGSSVGYCFDPTTEFHDFDFLVSIEHTISSYEDSKNIIQKLADVARDNVEDTLIEIFTLQYPHLPIPTRRNVWHMYFGIPALINTIIDPENEILGNRFSLLRLGPIEIKIAYDLTIGEKLIPGIEDAYAFSKDCLRLPLKQIFIDGKALAKKSIIRSVCVPIKDAIKCLRIKELLIPDYQVHKSNGSKFVKWLDYITFRQFHCDSKLNHDLFCKFLQSFPIDVIIKRLITYLEPRSEQKVGIITALLNIYTLIDNEQGKLTEPMLQLRERIQTLIVYYFSPKSSKFLIQNPQYNGLHTDWCKFYLILVAFSKLSHKAKLRLKNSIPLTNETKTYSLLIPENPLLFVTSFFNQSRQQVDIEIIQLYKNLLLQFRLDAESISNEKDLLKVILPIIESFLMIRGSSDDVHLFYHYMALHYDLPCQLSTHSTIYDIHSDILNYLGLDDLDSFSQDKLLLYLKRASSQATPIMEAVCLLVIKKLVGLGMHEKDFHAIALRCLPRGSRSIEYSYKAITLLADNPSYELWVYYDQNNLWQSPKERAESIIILLNSEADHEIIMQIATEKAIFKDFPKEHATALMSYIQKNSHPEKKLEYLSARKEITIQYLSEFEPLYDLIIILSKSCVNQAKIEKLTFFTTLLKPVSDELQSKKFSCLAELLSQSLHVLKKQMPPPSIMLYILQNMMKVNAFNSHTPKIYYSLIVAYLNHVKGHPDSFKKALSFVKDLKDEYFLEGLRKTIYEACRKGPFELIIEYQEFLDKSNLLQLTLELAKKLIHSPKEEHLDLITALLSRDEALALLSSDPDGILPFYLDLFERYLAKIKRWEDEIVKSTPLNPDKIAISFPNLLKCLYQIHKCHLMTHPAFSKKGMIIVTKIASMWRLLPKGCAKLTHLKQFSEMVDSYLPTINEASFNDFGEYALSIAVGALTSCDKDIIDNSVELLKKFSLDKRLSSLLGNSFLNYFVYKGLSAFEIDDLLTHLFETGVINKNTRIEQVEEFLLNNIFHLISELINPDYAEQITIRLNKRVREIILKAENLEVVLRKQNPNLDLIKSIIRFGNLEDCTISSYVIIELIAALDHLYIYKGQETPLKRSKELKDEKSVIIQIMRLLVQILDKRNVTLSFLESHFLAKTWHSLKFPKRYELNEITTEITITSGDLILKGFLNDISIYFEGSSKIKFQPESYYYFNSMIEIIETIAFSIIDLPGSAVTPEITTYFFQLILKAYAYGTYYDDSYLQKALHVEKIAKIPNIMLRYLSTLLEIRSKGFIFENDLVNKLEATCPTSLVLIRSEDFKQFRAQRVKQEPFIPLELAQEIRSCQKNLFKSLTLAVFDQADSLLKLKPSPIEALAVECTSLIKLFEPLTPMPFVMILKLKELQIASQDFLENITLNVDKNAYAMCINHVYVLSFYKALNGYLEAVASMWPHSRSKTLPASPLENAKDQFEKAKTSIDKYLSKYTKK